MAAKKESTKSVGEELFSLIDFIGKGPVLIIKNIETRKETDSEGKISSSERTSTFEVKLESK